MVFICVSVKRHQKYLLEIGTECLVTTYVNWKAVNSLLQMKNFPLKYFPQSYIRGNMMNSHPESIHRERETERLRGSCVGLHLNLWFPKIKQQKTGTNTVCGNKQTHMDELSGLLQHNIQENLQLLRRCIIDYRFVFGFFFFTEHQISSLFLGIHTVCVSL